MITICIPIYNQDVNALVDTLVEQCEAADIEFQILCFDDGSKAEIKDANKELSLKFNVNYTELPENHGRAKIRNKMARLARYNYILFLDCDSAISQEDFIANYVALVNKQHVVYGGRVYQQEKPAKPFRLHWNYGRKVEAKPLSKRLNSPYESFLTNNFLVTARVMKNYPFDESISSYGYEDLEWAGRLKSNNVFIHHINNPVVHLGLESGDVFLKKTITSVKTLASLHKQGKITTSRLISTFNSGFKRYLAQIIGVLLGVKTAEKKLVKRQGSLLLLQLYKLKVFQEAMRESK